MLLTKKIEVVLNGANMKHYENKGYEIPKVKTNRGNYTTPNGTKINVKIEDVPKNSDVVCVDVLCDYCKINISKKSYQKYNKQRNIIEKDCCDECGHLKLQEICFIKTGRINYMQLDEVKEKTGSKLRNNIDDIDDKFNNKGYILLDKNEYKNLSSKLHFICKNHIEKGIQYVSLMSFNHNIHNCKYCIRDIQIEERYGFEGNINVLCKNIRGNIKSWWLDSLTKYNFKCVLTNNSNVEVHHVFKNLNIIVKEVLKKLNYKTFKNFDLSSEDLYIVYDECLKLHYKYGLGMPLNKHIHKLFHKLYGVKDNNIIQFKEFVTRLRLGEFNNFLEENNLKISINRDFLDCDYEE